MQTLDGHIGMRLGRPWFWPFRRVLRSHGRRIPTFIPQANEFARKLAQAIGGTPMSMVTEILFDVPGTAHILGGARWRHRRSDGVVDSRNRLFGYKNLYVCDGSVIAANLGVNPSLTICALTERAMSHIPPAASAPGTTPRNSQISSLGLEFGGLFLHDIRAEIEAGPQEKRIVKRPSFIRSLNR